MNFHQNPNGWLAYSIEPRQLRTERSRARRSRADIAGRHHVRRALEVAAAGSHKPLAVGSTPTPAEVQ